MGYLDCPNCGRRLRVPDSPGPAALRCPACQHTFRSDGVPLGQSPRRAPDGEEATFLESDASGGRILSAADEAMLRDYGAGSGLLELTREAYGVAAAVAPAAPGAAEPAAEPPPLRDDPDRQFQIIGTALVLANKLVLAHKSELARTRRVNLLGWTLMAAMTGTAALVFWWAMSQTSLTSLERVRADNLSERLSDTGAQLAELKLRVPKLTDELEASRTEYRTAQSDLAAAREALAEKKGSLDALTGELNGANARLVALGQQVQSLQVDLAAAKASAEEAKAALAAARQAASQPASATSRTATSAP